MEGPPVFDQQCPSLVVSPSASDLQMPWRMPFATEAGPSYEGDGGAVGRHDVGFDPVQPEDPEGVKQGKLESLCQLPLPGIWSADRVAQEGTLRGAAHDFIDVDSAQQGPVLDTEHEQLLVTPAATRPEPLGELLSRCASTRRERFPGPRECRASPPQREVLVPIAGGGFPKKDAPPNLHGSTQP
jgi:hypothetical protein